MMNLKYFKGISTTIFGKQVDSPICMGPLDSASDLNLLCKLSGKVPIDDQSPSTIVQADAKHMN